MKELSTELKTRLKEDAGAVEKAIIEYLDGDAAGFEVLKESMLYSLTAGGKRIRPFLVIEFCRLFGGDIRAALPFAAGIEMMHTSSLIHDDLPCMDNDDLRRGKPTNHKVYGEANALLAGDALMINSFSAAACNSYAAPEDIVRAVKEMGECAGYMGMVGGQVLDLIGEKIRYGTDMLEYMQSLKTGKLIRLSCLLGCYAAGVHDEERLCAAAEYAANIGLCFQIIDDLLDVTGDEALLGKPIGSDAANGKNTFMNYYTEEQAAETAQRLTEQAKAAISGYEGSGILCELADYLLERKS